MFHKAQYYFAKKQLIFELLVPSLGGYSMSPCNRLNMIFALWEAKERQMIFLSFVIIFNDLVRNQNFPALPSKIVHLSHSLGGNAHLSCK